MGQLSSVTSRLAATTAPTLQRSRLLWCLIRSWGTSFGTCSEPWVRGHHLHSIAESELGALDCCLAEDCGSDCRLGRPQCTVLMTFDGSGRREARGYGACNVQMPRATTSPTSCIAHAMSSLAAADGVLSSALHPLNTNATCSGTAGAVQGSLVRTHSANSSKGAIWALAVQLRVAEDAYARRK